MAKLLFIQNIDFAFLGPMYISSMLKNNGHECRMAIGTSFDEIKLNIEDFKPHVCAFSVMTGSHTWAVRVAQQIKKHYDVVTVFGGPHPTFFPDIIKENGIDIVVRGEGEHACLEIMDSIESKKDLSLIRNTLTKINGEVIENEIRPFISDIDALPFPDRNLYSPISHRIDKSVVSVITSRGCPFKCAFCFNDSMTELYKNKGRYVRYRSPGNVIEELRKLKEDSRLKTIYFADDIFGMSSTWLKSFLSRYKFEIKLDFICLIRADVVASRKEFAKELSDAGCKSVFFGIESGDEKIRNTILRKNIFDKDIYDAAKLLHDSGIKFRTYNMVGIPGETIENAVKTLEMNIKIRTDYPWCSIFMPLPGTHLTEEAIKKGLLPEGYNPDNLNSSFFMSSPLRMNDIKQMENLQKFFQTVVLWPWTKKIVYLLIKLNPNFLFCAWFGIIYFYVYLKSEKRQFIRSLFFAFTNYKHILSRKT